MVDKRHEVVSASIATVQLHRLHQGKHQLVSFLYHGNPVLLCHHVELAIERMRRQEASFVHGLTFKTSCLLTWVHAWPAAAADSI